MRSLLESRQNSGGIEYLRIGILGGGLGVDTDTVWKVVLGPYY